LDTIGSAQTLRILLISAREATRDEVGEALSNWFGDQRLYWVAQSELALSRAQDLMPQVILVDSELEGANVISLIKALASRLPGVAIIALVEWDAMARASQAVLAGARAFVTKPIQVEELIAALRQVAGTARAAAEAPVAARPAGQAVVFCAPKGGTGRTTLAINTSLAVLEIAREPVVLIDADYASPAVDVLLNLPGERDIGHLLPRLARLDDSLVEGVLARHATGLQALLAPPPGELAAPITLPQVQQILVVLKRMFRWVFIDLGLPMDETAYAFLDGADLIVISVLPEMVGLRNTRHLLTQLYGRGYPADSIWLVLNRDGLPGGVPVRDIEDRLRVTVRHIVPDDQPLATHSVNRGVPIMVSHQRSALGKALRGLGERVYRELGDAAGPDAAAESGGLLGRLLSPRRSPSTTGG
jgi:pilus assembly protein CpaE